MIFSSPGATPVEVFASSWADRINSGKAVLTIRRAPADVSVPDHPGRIYFHLGLAAGATRVVSIRRLPLEGARNFRDLGGYRTSDGSYVRWGLVYRSNHSVNLTARDSEYLSSLGIRLVCDPDHWLGNAPEFFSVPIGSNLITSPTDDDLKRRVAAINAETKDSVRAYDYAIEYARQYGKILQRIAAGDLPVVEHCTAGKDRTGVFSAILLTALGVPRDTVVQDYMLSNKFLLAPDAIKGTAADLQLAFGLLEPPDLATVKTVMTARPETLEASPKMHGKQLYWPDMLLRCYVQPTAKRLGIAKQIGWDSFRRTFATLLKEQRRGCKGCSGTDASREQQNDAGRVRTSLDTSKAGRAFKGCGNDQASY